MATVDHAAAAPPLVREVVVDLADLRAGDLARAGGKAAKLGELIAAGLPVPGGFCVTNDAYARAAAHLDPTAPPRGPPPTPTPPPRRAPATTSAPSRSPTTSPPP